MYTAAITSDLYGEYQARMQKIADVKNASAVLQWDQETYLPAKGASFRGRQIASLSEIAHQLITEPGLDTLLQELLSRGDLAGDQLRNCQLTAEDLCRQKKLTGSFVRKLSETISGSFHAWIEARKRNDFSCFEKALDAVIHLKKLEADFIGYDEHPYDALLDEYEKGATVFMIDGIFNQVRKPLKDLLERITCSAQVDDSFLRLHYPAGRQWDFGMQVIAGLGFDFEAGRQDISEHPFTTSFNRNDVRLTTRIDENDFSGMLWSCIHETGHGLYEQGLPESQYGLPLGEYASLSIHESQSRLWENNVGRSASFWHYQFPRLQQVFADQLAAVTPDSFYCGINKVQPSLIRTEADELTYHFHVMIRYELEKLLLEGGLTTQDIPAYWNEQVAKYLGLQVPDDRNGCLQDVHWSHGSFGYFATYSLGSFYAAQFFESINKAEPRVSPSLEKGDSSAIFNWLKLNIYPYGRKYRSEELCRKACGETLNIQYFLSYIFDKYKKIYNF